MPHPEDEPTLEEILTSIQNIIGSKSEVVQGADDPLAPNPIEQPTIPTEPQIEVLELTQEMVRRPLGPSPVPAAAKADEPGPAQAEESVLERGAMRQGLAANDIFSDRTRKAVEKTFVSISDAGQFAPWGASVEGVFERAVWESFEPLLQKYLNNNSKPLIERMKPLIREWMDENFANLLDKIVRGEVERIVKIRHSAE